MDLQVLHDFVTGSLLFLQSCYLSTAKIFFHKGDLVLWPTFLRGQDFYCLGDLYQKQVREGLTEHQWRKLEYEYALVMEDYENAENSKLSI